MADDGLFSRDEVMAGLPAGRARTLLFLIESRTARLAAESRQALQIVPSRQHAMDREMAYFQAFAEGRDQPSSVTIQDIERYAYDWADLVPENPQVLAALARALSEKYRFTRNAVPRMRSILGLDGAPVGAAFERLYARPLDTIYVQRIPLRERARWTAAGVGKALDALPPFWTVVALIFTETVGASILALPIAMAGIGVLPGLLFLLVFGLINILTVVLTAEAFTRSGLIRYSDAFVGRLVADFLGGAATIYTTTVMFALVLIVLAAYYIGVGTTVESALHVPSEIVVIGLFLAGVYLVTRESLSAAISSALVIGAFNLCLIIIMGVLGLLHLSRSNLSYARYPLISHGFSLSLIGLLMGVVIAAYFGHLSIGNCARVVLKRDPSGRSLFWGCVVAQTAVIVLNSFWLLAINGSVAPSVLQHEKATALVPLQAVAGPAIYVIGLIYVVLAMGMASVHYSLALRNLVREWLPRRASPNQWLPLERTLVLGQSGWFGRAPGPDAPAAGLTYLGVEGTVPRIRVEAQIRGRIYRSEVPVSGEWDVREWLEGVPDIESGALDLSFRVLEVGEEGVRLALATSLTPVDSTWGAAQMRMTDLLASDDVDRQLVRWILRRGSAQSEEVAALTGQSVGEAGAVLDDLARRGLLDIDLSEGAPRYRPRLGRSRRSMLPESVWKAVADVPSAAPRVLAARVRSPWWALFSDERVRFALSWAPPVGVFLVTEWLLATGAASFAGALSVIGLVTEAVLAAVLPALLLAAGRKKGERQPAIILGFLGRPPALIAVYSLYLFVIFFYGLVVWTDPIQRAGAVLVGVGALVVTMQTFRTRAFRRRVLVELRQDVAAKAADLTVTESAVPVSAAEVEVEMLDGTVEKSGPAAHLASIDPVRRVTVIAPQNGAAELEVWAHRLTSADQSESLPCTAEIGGQEYDLTLVQGRLVLALAGPASVTLRLARGDEGAAQVGVTQGRRPRKGGVLDEL